MPGLLVPEDVGAEDVLEVEVENVVVLVDEVVRIDVEEVLGALEVVLLVVVVDAVPGTHWK